MKYRAGLNDYQIAILLWGSEFQCVYCGCDISASFTIDHKLPVSRGGSDDLTNLVVCCQRCNSQKGNKTPEEYSIWKSRSRFGGKTMGELSQESYKRQMANYYSRLIE
jgi:CRISPR/Cas system Type II protein with McrA/HNH and RuvC-like nuclease domain